LSINRVCVNESVAQPRTTRLAPLFDRRDFLVVAVSLWPVGENDGELKHGNSKPVGGKPDVNQR
jgi:hypothetical protein